MCRRYQQMVEIFCGVFQIDMAKMLSISQWTRGHIVNTNCKCLFPTVLNVVYKMGVGEGGGDISKKLQYVLALYHITSLSTYFIGWTVEYNESYEL